MILIKIYSFQSFYSFNKQPDVGLDNPVLFFKIRIISFHSYNIYCRKPTSHPDSNSACVLQFVVGTKESAAYPTAR